MATTEEIMNLIEEENYQKMREGLLQRNMQWAHPDWQAQMTQLPAQQEQAFNQWVQTNKVPFNPNDKYPDYDMRGYYQSLQQGQAPAAGVNPIDQQLHYPDTYKTPYHESFSSESKWATEGAPSWQNDERLVSPKGEVIFQTKPE